MSIYIKDMEMPTSCYKCYLKQRNGMDIVCPVTHERFSVADINILEYRLDGCPLIPFPDHGRLIDADAFATKIIEIVERQKYDDFYPRKNLSVGEILRAVVVELKGTGPCGYANAPTIIPADKEEDG